MLEKLLKVLFPTTCRNIFYEGHKRGWDDVYKKMADDGVVVIERDILAASVEAEVEAQIAYRTSEKVLPTENYTRH